MKINNVTVKEAMQILKKENGFSFVFESKDVDTQKTISINEQNVPVENVVSKILEGQNLDYIINGKNIILKKKSSVQPGGIAVTGTVTDNNGEPVPGVNVVLKGTTAGAVTDINGRYSVTVPNEKTVLRFSFVGYKTSEQVVGNQKSIHVMLEEDSQELEEIVVVGYGTVRRRDLTGSVASVSGAQLKDIPVTSASQAIAGRMPGVQVTKTEGSPDADIKIRVRGGGSITQDNSPLFIVDGFPVDNINDIAPTDIQSIDVLKDASSTAIYGARGANGVIIITTKSGFEGKAKISYNMYYGIKKITKKLDVLDPYEFVLWQFEAQSLSAASAVYGDYGDIDLYKSAVGTDWQEEVFGRTGSSLYNNISISGGTKAVKYNISLTRNDEKEIMLGSEYNRTNLSFKTSYELKNRLKFELNGRIADTNLKGAGTGMTSTNGETSARLIHVIQYRPVDGISAYVDPTLVDPGDYEAASQYAMNPVQQTNDDYRRYNQYVLSINGAVMLKIFENLNYRLELGTQYVKSQNRRFFGLHTADVWNDKHPMAEVRFDNARTYRMANTLTYSRRNILPGSNITVMLGEELNYSQSNWVRPSAKMFPKYIDPEGALSMMNLGTADPVLTFNNPANKISSFFGRLNYDYRSKYLLSLVMRADGSSKFARGNRWGYFPSAAVAWRISEEGFMSPTKSWLSSLKVRGSYGQSGNNRITDDAWKKTFTVSTSKLYVEGNEDTATSFLGVAGELSNPRLKWETTITRNVGLDFGLFKQRLTGTVELYKNTTKDLLIKSSIPPSSGYSSQWRNIGQTSNRGIEITLEGVLIDRDDFTLSASFNIGINKNRIDNLGENTEWEETSGWLGLATGPTGDYLVKTGESVGLMYGYQTDGMYTFDDFDYNETAQTYILKEGIPDNRALITAKQFWPGSLKFVNQPGDTATIKNGDRRNPIVDAKDKVVIGNANPKHTGGFSITAQYRGFDFSAFFNWVYGNKIYNANKLYFTGLNSNRLHKNLLAFMNSDNAFTYMDKTTGLLVSDPDQLKEMNKNANIWSAGTTATPLHSWGVEDGSFLRLNNITLGYSLPKSLLTKLKIEQLRIYVTGYNLWIWTNYTGFDPEVDTRRTIPTTPGVDWCAYPRSRTYNVGLNLTF
jgi:TonB-linked SusC/RagA family outer membrane protein